jgi:hypothetical protein
MPKQYAPAGSYASCREHHANLPSLAFYSYRHFRQAALQQSEHVLQFGEFAGAVAFGNCGIDGFL